MNESEHKIRNQNILTDWRQEHKLRQMKTGTNKIWKIRFIQITISLKNRN